MPRPAIEAGDSRVKVLAPARYRGDWASRLPRAVEVVWYDTPEDAIAKSDEAEAAWIDFADSKAIVRLMAAAGKLRWLSTHAAGIETFPVAAISRRGISLTNGAGLSAIPVAEFAILGMLALAKNFPEYIRAQDRREWLTKPPNFGELAGTHALIIGLGGIGTALAARLRALEVTVTGVRRRPGDEPNVIGPDAWRARLAEFDWVILSAPLTGDTRFAIDRSELAAMRATARIINVARGGLINQEALVDALESNRIAGAYLDVTDPEPVSPSARIWSAPNTIITAHLSGSATTRLTERAGRLFADNLARYLDAQPLTNLVASDVILPRSGATTC